jgi:hypothetical protein
MTAADLAMLSEVEEAVAKMTSVKWSVDVDAREGGVDQIIDAQDLAIAFMTVPMHDDDDLPLRDALGIVLLRNNAVRLLELARKGAEKP